MQTRFLFPASLLAFSMIFVSGIIFLQKRYPVEKKPKETFGKVCFTTQKYSFLSDKNLCSKAYYKKEKNGYLIRGYSEIYKTEISGFVPKEKITLTAPQN